MAHICRYLFAVYNNIMITTMDKKSKRLLLYGYLSLVFLSPTIFLLLLLLLFLLLLLLQPILGEEMATSTAPAAC